MEPGDKQKMREYILHFIRFPEDIKKMGLKSTEIVQDFYPENVIPKLNNIYLNLLS
jgi:hypothetical protein